MHPLHIDVTASSGGGQYFVGTIGLVFVEKLSADCWACTSGVADTKTLAGILGMSCSYWK